MRALHAEPLVDGQHLNLGEVGLLLARRLLLCPFKHIVCQRVTSNGIDAEGIEQSTRTIFAKPDKLASVVAEAAELDRCRQSI